MVYGYEEARRGFGAGTVMSLTLAERSNLISPSATLAMAAEAKRLKAGGLHVLDFALGEPDFPTPENIQQAAIRAMTSGQTRSEERRVGKECRSRWSPYH